MLPRLVDAVPLCVVAMALVDAPPLALPLMLVVLVVVLDGDGRSSGLQGSGAEALRLAGGAWASWVGMICSGLRKECTRRAGSRRLLILLLLLLLVSLLLGVRCAGGTVTTACATLSQARLRRAVDAPAADEGRDAVVGVCTWTGVVAAGAAGVVGSAEAVAALEKPPVPSCTDWARARPADVWR